MPKDEIGRILVELLGITIDNEHRKDILHYKKDDVDQARQSLSKYILKKRKELPDPSVGGRWQREAYYEDLACNRLLETLANEFWKEGR